MPIASWTPTYLMTPISSIPEPQYLQGLSLQHMPHCALSRCICHSPYSSSSLPQGPALYLKPFQSRAQNIIHSAIEGTDYLPCTDCWLIHPPGPNRISQPWKLDILPKILPQTQDPASILVLPIGFLCMIHHVCTRWREMCEACPVTLQSFRYHFRMFQ